MNNLLKSSMFRVRPAAANLLRLVHNSKPTATAPATITSLRPPKKLSLDHDQMPVHQSVLKNNIKFFLKASRQYEKNLNGIGKLHIN